VTGAWTTLRVTPGPGRESVLAALFSAGALALEESGDDLLTQFPPGTDMEPIVAAIQLADPQALVITGIAPVIDWTERWKDRITAHDVGALTVTPPWLADQHDPARTVVIDPGMAFGTGEHATTRGVMRLLQGVIRPGDRVADLGAGSAVLAIAAVKLGAGHALAIELDPDAIGNAEANVVRNGVTDRVVVLQGDAAALLPLAAPVRVITANIISSVLLGLLDDMQRALAPDGQVILSGILQAERDDMLESLGEAGWHLQAEDAEDLWWSAVVVRR
jgi:ribosomal protein L11 methyltransferase